MATTPIAEHALLSDCNSAALVTSGGSVDWFCCPRFDSPSLFARVLDADAGHWSITPVDPVISRQRRYLGRTLVLETRLQTASGTVVLVDALATGPNPGGHDLGADVPHLLLRRVDCVDGSVELEIDFAPRPEYGLTTPQLEAVDGGVVTWGGPASLALSTPVPLQVDDGRAHGRHRLTAGTSLLWGLNLGPGPGRDARLFSRAELEHQLTTSHHAWEEWSEQHANYQGPWQELVDLSGRVLQGLTYVPTGAIVAAPTTSLPEEIGGERNWDYRYSWVRDASFTLEALWVAACPHEAHTFFRWLTQASSADVRQGRPLQIVFGIGGEHDLSERTIGHLRGWRDSLPVRVGNGAWDQEQIDVYGELLAAAHRLSSIVAFDDAAAQYLCALADTAGRRWTEPDQGIWEVRSGPRHFVYSKLMCWVALDRAISLADRFGAQSRVAGWRATARDIRTAILDRGWNADVGSFTQSFESPTLDASVLMIPIVGFLPADDPRVVSTIDVIEERLTDERGLVYRYLETDDGLRGGEGSFLLCTFWLAEALAWSGRPDRARVVFERAIAFVNELGLMSEEVDAGSGELLGNFPQAFSHIGLVNAAYAISQAELTTTPGGAPGTRTARSS